MQKKKTCPYFMNITINLFFPHALIWTNCYSKNPRLFFVTSWWYDLILDNTYLNFGYKHIPYQYSVFLFWNSFYANSSKWSMLIYIHNRQNIYLGIFDSCFYILKMSKLMGCVGRRTVVLYPRGWNKIISFSFISHLLTNWKI